MIFAAGNPGQGWPAHRPRMVRGWSADGWYLSGGVAWQAMWSKQPENEVRTPTLQAKFGELKYIIHTSLY